MIEFKLIDQTCRQAYYSEGRCSGPYCYEDSWIRMFQQVFPYELKGYMINVQGREIGALYYVIMKSCLWGNRIVSLPFADEGGVMINSSEVLTPQLRRQVIEKISQKLDEEAVLNRAAYVEFRGDGVLLASPEAGAFFVRRKAYVKFVLDTTLAYPLLRKRFHSNILKNLKKAERFVEVRECCLLAELKEMYQIYLLEMRRLGGLPLPISYFEHLWCHKVSKIFLAVINGKIVGFLMLLIFQQRVMADINASLAGTKSFFPKVRLYDAAIRWSSEQGFHSFDFMRTRPGTGLYGHKEKWGGTEEPIWYYTRFYNKKANHILDADQKRFYFPRLCVRLTPLLLLEKFGAILRIGLGK